MLIEPRDLSFEEKLILGPAPAGAPKNVFFAQVVLETFSFYCLLQHIFLILNLNAQLFGVGPSGGTWGH